MKIMKVQCNSRIRARCLSGIKVAHRLSSQAVFTHSPRISLLFLLRFCFFCALRKNVVTYALLYVFFVDGLLQKRNRYRNIAHGALLTLLLGWTVKPLHEALIVEDVFALGKFANETPVNEGVDANDTVLRSELV